MRCPQHDLRFTRDPVDGLWRKPEGFDGCWIGPFSDEDARRIAEHHPTRLEIEPGDFPDIKESN